MKTKSLFLTNKGFTIVEMIFSLIILIFSLLTISSVSKMITDFSSRISSKQKLTNIKSDMINNVSQSKIWINLVSNADKAHPTKPGIKMNSDLLCLKNRTNCNVGTYDLTLMDMNGNLLTDPNTATKGFDSNGVACNSYGVDPNCAFRFSLNWTAICPASETSCLNPQIKVKIMATSSNQVYANTKTLSPFELLVAVNKDSDPVIKKAVVITNSTHHFASEAPVSFDPTPYIFSENKDIFSIGLSPDSPNSVNGGTLSTSGNIITYTPSAKFYGFDQFQYTVTNPITGKSYLASAWVWVMTPYTWTGLGSNSNTSTLKNFCGKVKNGSCDGSTFPANDKHYIFNSSCTNCNVSLNSDPSTLEMSKDYNGTIQQAVGTVSIANSYSNTWVKLPIYSQSAGTFDGGNNILLVDMSRMPWGYGYTNTDTAFSLDGGNFKSPSTALRVVGPLKISNSSSFNHNNGLVNVFKIYNTNSKVEAPNVHFYNLQFDHLSLNYGSHFEFRVTDNFTVDNNLIHSGRGTESSIRSATSAVISVKGNVYTEGVGGTYGYVNQAIIMLDGNGDQGIYGTAAPASPIKPNYTVTGQVSFLPIVQIKKTSGKVIIKDWVGFGGFEVLQTPGSHGLEAIDTSSATFVFGLDSGTITFTPGNFHYNDVYFVPGGSSYVDMFINAQTLNIDGNMYHYTQGASHLYGLSGPSTQVNLLGDLYIEGGYDHDRTAQAITVNMNGSNSAKIYGTNTSISQAHININKNPGTQVEMIGGFGTARDLTVSSGVLKVEPNMLVRIPNHGWNGFLSTFNTPGVQFHNMSIDHGFRATSNILLDGDLSIGTNGGGGYALSLGGAGQFILQGNLNLGSHLPYGGGQKILFTGVNDSAINFTANPTTQKNLGTTEFLINKETPSTKVTYNAGSVRIANLSVSRGTLEMISTSSIQTNTASSAAATSIINKNGNTIAATTTNFLGTVNP